MKGSSVRVRASAPLSKLASLLSHTGSADAGLEHGERAVAITKDEQRSREELATALWELGWAHYAAGNWLQSAAASREALEIHPHLIPVRFNLGLALLCAGDVDAAEAEYRRAADDVEDSWDLKFYGMQDLKAVLAEEPDLARGEEILSLLKDRYETLKGRRKRSS
jgi:tetratricopeptide (TPR) repeat protein